jgi:DNA primase
MACHLAGVETAVATCGTAFAADHIRIVRRLLGDDRSIGQGGQVGGQVIFLFDGDAAGQKAAVRAFEDDQRFVAQTYIAVAQDGMDPCELRQAKGDEAIRELAASRQPLFEFAIRSSIASFDLDSAEGRTAAARFAIPIVAQIKDISLRDDYARRLAGWLGLPERDMLSAVRQAQRGGSAAGSSRERGTAASEQRPRIDPRDPIARAEREALECMLQVPRLVPASDADSLGDGAFEVPSLRAIHHAIRSAGGMAAAATLSAQAWAEAVREEAPEAVAALVTELAVTPLPTDTDEALARYASSVVLRVAEVDVSRAIGTLRSRLQRLDPSAAGYQEAFADLLAAEARRRSLRERISGG